MSYPIQCIAGFPMPLAAGKFEIVGLRGTIETTSATAQLAIFDDEKITKDDKHGRLIPLADIYNTKVLLFDSKGYASADTEIFYSFDEPIKTRYGISISADNIKGGSIIVYRR